MAPGPFNSDEFERHRDFIKFSVEEKILQFCRRKVGLSCQIFRFGSKSVQATYPHAAAVDVELIRLPYLI